MSALYDSGLFDSEDMAQAYDDGFNTAMQTLAVVVTRVCPLCTEPLLATKHSLRSLPLVVHSGFRWCLKCETEVPAMIRIST